MPYDFYKYLRDPKNNRALLDMPPIKISSRITDKFITYDKAKNRLDYIAGQVYQDETLWKIIMWANPEYSIEFDIPSGSVIRVPYPINEVLSEITSQLIDNRDK
jgi:AAA15 family ATPase/GTPase